MITMVNYLISFLSKKKIFLLGAWDNVTGMNAPLYGRSYRDGDVNNNEWNVVSDEEKLKLNDLICCLEWFSSLLVDKRLSGGENQFRFSYVWKKFYVNESFEFNQCWGRDDRWWFRYGK
jgi:hypothetical protein